MNKLLRRTKEVLKCPIRMMAIILVLGSTMLFDGTSVLAAESSYPEEMNITKFTQPETVEPVAELAAVDIPIPDPKAAEIPEQTLIGPDGFWNKQRGENWTMHFTEQDVLDCAWVLWFEYGACKSFTEKSKVVWTICNRVDDPRWANDFRGVVSEPDQFSWHGEPNPNKMSKDVVIVARDVLERWNAEKNGMTNVGRTLPKDSIGFYGDGQRNHFYALEWPGPRVYYKFSPEEGPYYDN